MRRCSEVPPTRNQDVVMSRITRQLRRTTESDTFQAITLYMILANAILLGLQTYP